MEQSPVIVLTYLTGMCVENRTDAKAKRNACAFLDAKGGMVRSDFVTLCASLTRNISFSTTQID